MKLDDYQRLESMAKEAFEHLPDDLRGTYTSLNDMCEDTKEQLRSEHLLFKEGDRFQQSANGCKFWPSGRGIFLNKKKSFVVWVGEEDHLRIISLQNGGDVRIVYEQFARGVKSLQESLEFSYSERLGYLTFCPSNLGTAIRASVHIKLPRLALTGQENLESIALQYRLQVRGSDGEHSASKDGIYDVSNKERLGLTEFEAVAKMFDGVKELIDMEKELDE